MKNMTTTTAILKRLGKSVPSKFANEGRPNRRALEFDADGNKIEFWVDDVAPVPSLQVGALCTLVHDGKGYAIADIAPAPAAGIARSGGAGSSAVFTLPAKEVRENMMAYIEFEGKLYRHCYDVAAADMEEINLKPETVKDVATTLFLSAMRKFNLQ